MRGNQMLVRSEAMLLTNLKTTKDVKLPKVEVKMMLLTLLKQLLILIIHMTMRRMIVVMRILTLDLILLLKQRILICVNILTCS